MILYIVTVFHCCVSLLRGQLYQVSEYHMKYESRGISLISCKQGCKIISVKLSEWY